TQEVEDIAFHNRDIAQPVSSGIRSSELNRSGRQVNRLDGLADTRKLKRKSPAITESIQRTAPGMTAGSAVIVALVQIASRLLAGGQRDLHLLTIFIDNHGWGRLFTNPASLDRKILKFANLAIISKNDRS